jgi:hypothetical protein
MTTPEFRAICERLGTSPDAFARLIGAHGRPNWIRANDTGPVPPAVAALARIAEAVAGRMAYPALARLLREEADRLARL